MRAVRAAGRKATYQEGRSTMKMPIAVHTDEDYERAQQRVAELNAAPDSKEKERELEALADAMLAFELRRDEAQE
ncbi:hypothetical protein WBO78_02960 [Bosea sp. CCNWLW174]|nr:hypothetical protein [Bosea sp. FBZP-16]